MTLSLFSKSQEDYEIVLCLEIIIHVIFSSFSESGSPAFDEFLNLIGERVRLKGFENYRAQLDNKSKVCRACD